MINTGFLLGYIVWLVLFCLISAAAPDAWDDMTVQEYVFFALAMISFCVVGAVIYRDK